MNWIRVVLGDNADIQENNVYFIQVEMQDLTLQTL